MRKNKAGFIVSPTGRHTPTSIGRDIGLHDIIDKAGKSIGKNKDLLGHFSKLNGTLDTASKILTVMRFANGLKSGLVDNGQNPVANNDSKQIPLTSQTYSTQVGKNDARYVKSHVHMGKPSSKKIMKIQDSAFVQKITKSLADSSKDYQSHEKRKSLTIKGGFNEKSYTFLGEDHCLTVNDFYQLFKIKKWYKDVFQEDDGITEVFGCVRKTHNKIKLKNRLDYFSVHVKISLLKIHDLNMDTRSLLKDITNNNHVTSSVDSGRIPIDLQFSNPELYPINNKSTINFLTDLSCNLNLSTKFKEQASIVRSWSTTLSPGSTWEFNLTHHYGKGVNLNFVSDLYNRQLKEKVKQEIEIPNIKKAEKPTTNSTNTTTNSTNTTQTEDGEPKTRKVMRTFSYDISHPVSHVIFLECVGDRRSSIIRNEDNDVFSGYSPFQLGMEFLHEITYLQNQDSPTDLLVYKNQKNRKNFDDDEAEFANIFCPDRQPGIHIPFENIRFSGKISGQKKLTDYRMEYDQVIAGTNDLPNILDNLKDTFNILGLDPKSLSEDDAGLNFNNRPDEEYQGPDTAPPPENNNNDN